MDLFSVKIVNSQTEVLGTLKLSLSLDSPLGYRPTMRICISNIFADDLNAHIH